MACWARASLAFSYPNLCTAMSPAEIGNGCSDMASCCYDRHDDSDICLKCFQTKKDHCISSSKSKSHPLCPGELEIASLAVKYSRSLRTIRLKSTKDVHQVTFTLCSPDDQERLTRFLQFLQVPGTSPPPPKSMEVFLSIRTIRPRIGMMFGAQLVVVLPSSSGSIDWVLDALC